MDQLSPRDREAEEGARNLPDDRDVIEVGGGGDGAPAAAGKPRAPSAWIFAGVGLVLVALLAWGAYGHWKTDSAAAEAQRHETGRVPKVRVVKARGDDAPIGVTLPGETQPFTTANIFPRATGYIAERHVDIGSRVKKGELMVRIAAPDLDQQLEQALAQLGQTRAALLQANANVTQAEANLNLAKVNLQRAEALVGKGFETLQNRDQLEANQISQSANLDASRAAVKVAEANIKAQQATVDRLKALTAFEEVRAPFEGVVTARNVDVGDLMNADTTTGTPMFTVDETDVLRVLVQTPQNASLGVRNGLEAEIHVPQMPGQTFTGTVSRTAVALQTSARTLTVEVDIPNQSGALRSGLYAYVTLRIPRTHPVVVLPAETLIYDQHGTHVAAVGDDGAVRMVEIKITRDFGTTFEVDEGPKPGERIVLSPPAILREGSKVKVEDGDETGS